MPLPNADIVALVAAQLLASSRDRSPKAIAKTVEQAVAVVEATRARIKRGAETELTTVELQNLMMHQQQVMQMLANMTKVTSDTLQALVDNLR